jgi:fucose 4-O-acetylase-like acetyltransferase
MMVNTKQRNPLLDAVKGVLILCIVLEHNRLLTNNYDWIRPFCDAFAAGCFLIFTFAWPTKRLPLTQYLDKNLAYLWPYIILISLTSVINFIIFSAVPLNDAFFNFIRALTTASPEVIKVSSGFMYLWFLPALCFIYVIRYFTEYYPKATTIVAAIVWLNIGIIEDSTLITFPFSLHVIGFIFFLGLIYQKLHPKLISSNIYIKSFCITSFITCSIASYFIGWELFLAAGIIPSWREPLLILFYSYFMLIAIPGIYHLLSFVPLGMNNFLIYLGKNSLIVYLIHPLIFIAFTQVFPIIDEPLTSFLLTIALCLLVTLTLEKISVLNQFFFPKKISFLIKNRDN